MKRNALPYGDKYEVLREHLDDETAALAYLEALQLPSVPRSDVQSRFGESRAPSTTSGAAVAANLATVGIGGDSGWPIRVTKNP